MKKKCLTIGIIFLFIGITIIPSNGQKIEKSSQPTSSGHWLYVGGSGPGNYSKIQDAIDNASDGDTVYVFRGIYNESITIDKSIAVLGEDKNNTIIDGQFKKTTIVQLDANYINFSGFKITHCSHNATSCAMSISTNSCSNIVTENIVTDNQGNHGSIVIMGDYNQIKNNIIRNQSDIGSFNWGIAISNTASDNIISENYITANPIGIWDISQYNNIITKNHICNNNRQGIWIASTEGNEYSYNIIENNGDAAIYVEEHAVNDIIQRNTMKNNGKGLVIADAQSETITMNSFYGQGIQLTANALQYWTSHTISYNTINDKPIYFFKSEENLIVPPDAGQIILVNCTKCLLQNENIENVDYGILLGYSSNNTITNNQFFNITGTAITLKESPENEILNNYIFNCYNGVMVGALSDSIILHENVIKNNIGCGIYLRGSSNYINRNSLENNNVSVCIDFSDFNNITMNNFINNSEHQITYLIDYLHPKSNRLRQNYYDAHYLIIKIIYGRIRTRFTWEPIPGDIEYIYRIGFIIDWHPALKPYTVTGGR
ncbi:MAG TPA: NosD domain-containing protein [Candidatus Thermoplasmatota archaeon]|nr:NosD domain-containing protein [Candidatus Thermoplasmatota archaeon]